MLNTSSNLYDRDFQELIRTGSLQSARVVVPLVMDLVAPQSVVDVGCGSGSWLSVFAEAGVRNLVGLEGSPADSEVADVEPSLIQVCDLSKSFHLGRTFDLAMSLEVAEHLPEDSATVFIESLAELAPVILFSAAVPGQGGVGHLNEQWPTYWADHFAKLGFETFDCLRDRVWQDGRIEWWYRQNLLLFIQEQTRSNYPRINQAHLQARQGFPAALDRKMPVALQRPVENLLPGDRPASVSVTAAIASNGGPERLAACLRSIFETGFADEIVVCLDRDAPSGSREAALMFTRHVYDIESEGYLESALPLLVAHCSGEYVLRIDDDELLGGAWTKDGFDGLVRMNSFTHFWLPRRWIIPPGDLFLSNDPWFPDLQLRLFRNDPRLIVWPSQIHNPMKLNGRGMTLADRYIDHWTLVSSSRPEREKKCERYRLMRPNHDLSQFYLYEDHKVEISRADQEGFRSVVLGSVSAVPRPQLAVYNPGQLVDFRSGGNSVQYVLQGWNHPESWGTWTDGEVAEVFFFLQEPFKADLLLTASLRAFVGPLHPVVRVEVECNGHTLGDWILDSAATIEKSVLISRDISAKDRTLNFLFRIYHPASPYGLGQSTDRRLLGLGFSTLRIAPLTMS